MAYVELPPVLHVSFLPSLPTVALLVPFCVLLLYCTQYYYEEINMLRTMRNEYCACILFLILDEDDKGACRRANVSFQRESVSFQPATEPALPKFIARD
jgi:hypothetical protein